MRKNLLIFSVAATCLAGSCSMLHAGDLSQYVYVESNPPQPTAIPSTLSVVEATAI
jgi:hypothetical protein